MCACVCALAYSPMEDLIELLLLMLMRTSLWRDHDVYLSEDHYIEMQLFNHCYWRMRYFFSSLLLSLYRFSLLDLSGMLVS